MAVEANVRGLSRYYAEDKVECLEIRIAKPLPPELPFVEDEVVMIQLVVNGERFEAKLNAPTGNPYAWISPDLKDGAQCDVKLARVLKAAAIEKNQSVTLEVDGLSITLCCVT